MGSYVADLAFRTPRLPRWGETVMGASFALGPGGKGSNQAVAAARLGADVVFITKLGRDTFGELALRTYKAEGIDSEYVFQSAEHATGGAAIIIDEIKGENAIVVVPGACFQLTTEEVGRSENAIASSAIFLTQLELPIHVVEHGLRLARKRSVPTILNPAPAHELPPRIYPLCDYLIPNETEAGALAGIEVSSLADAERAAEALLGRGARNAVITLGAQGALVKNAGLAEHISAFAAGPVVETTGAGDAFSGGFAVALAEGMDIVAAARFGCAVAGISVTRPGTAPSMPQRSEVEKLLNEQA
jgi:ribokinase